MINKKYGVLSHTNGGFTFFDSKEEAIEEFWKRMIAIGYEHMQHTCYVTVEKNEDGTETWYNESDKEIDKILSTEEQEELIRKTLLEISEEIV